MRKSFTLLLLPLFALVAAPLFAQQQNKLDKALRHLEQRAEEWGLKTADLMDVVVSDEYVSKHNGVHHYYLVQRYAGVPLYAAVNGVHFDRQGEVAYATNNFEGNLAERVNVLAPQTTPQAAVMALLDHLQIARPASLTIKNQTGNKYLFAADGLANSDFEVQLRFMPVRETNEIRLAWHVVIDVRKSADYWSVLVDAVNNEILHQHNYTVYCNFSPQEGHTTHADNCAHQLEGTKQVLRPLEMVSDGAGYNVFPLPAESPIHGDRELIFDPSDAIASPFGWHDTDGMEGADHTITRGNNVHAYLDLGAINSSSNDEPDGGEDLLFDFYFDVDDEPENMQESAVTQLFYMNNMMHDITFAYGFDEESGNFQQRNYTGVDGSNDQVLAEAQDGSGTNNANFSTPSDGANGRMQMYRWFGVEGSVLNFSEPETIAGSFESGTADYGPPVSDVPITAEVVQAFDASGAPNLVCEAVANADEVNGKIALIDRGDCFFEEKTINAEAAGAVAVIICNYLEEALGMAGGVDGTDPGIPTVSMKASDCQQIKNVLAMGETVTATIVLPEDSGPESVGSSMDNGVIAHEYGHGISNRLTGGPANSDCLFNDEQQGEGWSDFFALITTVRPGDTAETPRGIGNYADRKPADGGGIRRVPYTTDLTFNDHIMDDILNTTAPHPLGEVWATAVWDLYWAMVDLYGFDEDIINGTGGNNMAIQLVMDGMKFQRCNPGFMDARDALFTADFLNYDGVHECLIWEVFARRGMGEDADQNDRFDRNDNLIGFATPPECTKTLKIAKSADRDLIVAGEDIEYTLVVRNDKDEDATGVTVEDELPAGLTYIPGSATGADVTDNGDNLVFTIGDLPAGDDVTITYQVSSDPDSRSIQLFYDGMEDGDGNWDFDAAAGFDIWGISDQNPNTGENSWFVANVAETNDQSIILIDPFEVNGVNPTVRFYHDYDTQPLADGGLVQVSTNGGMSWENLNDAFIRGDYRGELAAQTLFSPSFRAFWGNSEGYVDSYIDLSAYQGETIQIRFRFASNGDTGATGWYMDDFEVMDKLAYEGEACVSSNEGDLDCASVAEGGVIVDTDLSNDTEDPVRDPQIMQVYPNPTSNVLNIAINMDLSSTVDVRLVNAAGAVVRQWREQGLQGQLVSLNVSDVPTGFYVLQLHTPQGIYTEKVTIQ